jgi:hypothetical protein
VPAGADAAGGRQGRRAAAAGDVEHARAGRQPDPLDRAAADAGPEAERLGVVRVSCRV